MKWAHQWRCALRLAARDATRHRTRTILAAALVSLPVAWMVVATTEEAGAPSTREDALAAVPGGVQALVVATASSRDDRPVRQDPESVGTHDWRVSNDPDELPATAAELSAVLPSQDRLVQVWSSAQLLATTGTDLAPGQESPAGEDMVPDTASARLSTAQLHESGPQGLSLLLPPLTTGSPPADATEAVVSSALAEQLGVTTGDKVTFVVPTLTIWIDDPFAATITQTGRTGEVMQGSQRAYQVVGVADSQLPQAWTTQGWVAGSTAASPHGIPAQYLVVGDEPVTWDHAKAANRLQAVVTSRYVLTHYPPKSELYANDEVSEQVVVGLITVVLAIVTGSLLVLFLVTPAFAVSVDQSRRTLGLAAAAGAGPHDLRRLLTTQGIVVGLAGGALGCVLGVAGAVFTPVNGTVITDDTPLVDLGVRFAWWIFPLAVGVAAAIGMVASAGAAHRASRLHPVDALKDRPAPPRPGRRRWALGGPVLVAAGVGAGALNLALAPVARPFVLVLLLLAVIALVVTGLVLVVRSVADLGAHLAHRLPVAPRLAVRDAADHQSRFVPAALAVLMTTGLASFTAVMVGSTTADEQTRTVTMTVPGHLTLSVRQPVSEAFDRLVLSDVVDVLATELPVSGHEPVFAVEQWGDDASPVVLVAQQVPDLCPRGTEPDDASRILGAPLRCTRPKDPDGRSSSTYATPWWAGFDLMVMSGDAMRASGLPGADGAGATLDAGGVVVRDATLVSDGTVRVGLVATDEWTGEELDEVVALPGAFVQGTADLVVSPATAQSLGVRFFYVGEYVASDTLSSAQLARAQALVAARTNYVRLTAPDHRHTWGRSSVALVPIATLVAVAILATAICLALAKTQVRRDMATMHAVGAPRRFLRRFSLTQAVVVLVAGVPLGVASGIALGVFQVAWLRTAGERGELGAWIHTVVMWPVQAGIMLAVVVAGLLTGVLLGQPPRELVRRSID
ncbi:MAG: ABC transporter permease [Micrococcales bacterium]|nr:ABC transporter permease [Micrococcales bacterium]